MSTPGSPNNPDDPTEGASESGSSGGEGNPPGPGDTNILPPDEVHDLDEDMRPAASKTVKVQTADVEGADSSASKGSSEAGSTGNEESGSSDAGKSGEQGGSAGGGEGGGDEPPSGTAPSGGDDGKDRQVNQLLETIRGVINDRVTAGHSEKEKALRHVDMIRQLLAKCRDKDNLIRLLKAALKNGGDLDLQALVAILMELFTLLSNQTRELASALSDPVLDEAEQYLAQPDEA